MSDSCVNCTAPATRNMSLQILFKCPTPANFLETAAKPSRFAHFRQSAESLAPATHILTSKNGPGLSVLNMFDFDMCFRPQHRALLNISTSKSVPSMLCFVLFDSDMCFAPQPCAPLTSQIPKVVREWCVL